LQKIGVDRRSTETELGMFISKLFSTDVTTTQRTIDGRRRWCWEFTSLDGCRRAFDHATRSDHPWPKDNE
jgi:hypothetical protein